MYQIPHIRGGAGQFLTGIKIIVYILKFYSKHNIIFKFKTVLSYWVISGTPTSENPLSFPEVWIRSLLGNRPLKILHFLNEFLKWRPSLGPVYSRVHSSLSSFLPHSYSALVIAHSVQQQRASRHTHGHSSAHSLLATGKGNSCEYMEPWLVPHLCPLSRGPVRADWYTQTVIFNIAIDIQK